MPKRHRRVIRYMPALKRHRGHRGGGGSRWGIEFADAVPGAMLEFVGEAIRNELAKYPNMPQFVRDAPVSALGLYALGVAFNRESWRSLGAGQLLGRALGIIKTAVNP